MSMNSSLTADGQAQDYGATTDMAAALLTLSHNDDDPTSKHDLAASEALEMGAAKTAPANSNGLLGGGGENEKPGQPGADSGKDERCHELYSCFSCADCRECCGDVGDLCRQAGRRCSEFSCKQCMSKTCSVENVKRKLPIFRWLPKYRCRHFQGDLIAGLTVGLTVIPQGLAYAIVAELPPQYGLYSAFMGAFVYCFLGTSKDITLGPTAIMSLMTAEFGRSPLHNDATVAVVLTLFSGIIQLAMGLLNLGFLVDFISHPVINSFTTSAAITIGFGQIKTWLGLKGVPREFMHQVYYTFKKIPETNIWDFVLGLVCMIILYTLKRVKQIQWSDDGHVSLPKQIFRKIIWIVGTARNALVVIVASGVAAILLFQGIDVLSLTQAVKPGLPDFRIPRFSVDSHMGPNGTMINDTLTTAQIFESIGAGFAVVPIIGLVETIAISKAFARKNNYAIDASQELIAIGASNIVGSFVSSYPVTGSFSRTAVNSQSGVMSPAGGIWTGALVLLSLGVLTPLFKYIPSAGLAGVIIMAVVDMIDFSLLLKLWRVKKIDLIPWIACFIFSFVLGIEYGIIIGVGISLLLLLYPWGRPTIKAITDDSTTLASAQQDTIHKEVMVFQPNMGMRFPGVEYLKEKVTSKALSESIPRSVVLDMRHINDVDYTTVQGFQEIMLDFRARDVSFVMSNVQPHVLTIFQSAAIKELRYAGTTDEAVKLIYEEHEPLEDNPQQGLLSRNTPRNSTSSIPNAAAKNGANPHPISTSAASSLNSNH